MQYKFLKSGSRQTNGNIAIVKTRNVVFCAMLLSIPIVFWQSRVNSVVTEPYLVN